MRSSGRPSKCGAAQGSRIATSTVTDSAYSPEGICQELGGDFALVAARAESHTTPGGMTQPFSCLYFAVEGTTWFSDAAPHDISGHLQREIRARYSGSGGTGCRDRTGA
jgi:hypothetical protein